MTHLIHRGGAAPERNRAPNDSLGARLCLVESNLLGCFLARSKQQEGNTQEGDDAVFRVIERYRSSDTRQ